MASFSTSLFIFIIVPVKHSMILSVFVFPKQHILLPHLKQLPIAFKIKYFSRTLPFLSLTHHISGTLHSTHFRKKAMFLPLLRLCTSCSSTATRCTFNFCMAGTLSSSSDLLHQGGLSLTTMTHAPLLFFALYHRFFPHPHMALGTTRNYVFLVFPSLLTVTPSH